MKTVLLAAALTLVAWDRAAADPAEDALMAKAEACIHSAVPEVAAEAQTLSDAIEAVSWRCAVEFARVENYDANAKLLADWQGRSSPSQLVGVSLDPATGDLVTPPGFKMEWDSSSAWVRETARVTPKTKLLAFSAEAVIAARRPAAHR